jgi:hypothetical protein
MIETTKRVKNVVFWDVAPCKSCVNRRFEVTIASIFRVEKSASEEPEWLQALVHAGFLLVDFSTLKMEAIHSFETSVDTIRI